MENLEDKIKKFLSVSSGSGDGFGSGDGYGSSYGYGSGSGYGDDYGDGYGSGYDYGNGVGEFQGKRVYNIDDEPTIIDSIHGNIAKGYILNADFTLEECYVAKAENRYFAHGSTPRKAFHDAMSKAFEDMPEDERIESFVKEFPTLDTIVANATLFDWHNRLTGSCEMGRRNFAQQHDIDVENGQMSVRRFIGLTKDSYGGEVIEQLYKAYKY